MSNSVRPHRRQPSRLRRPWDSPGKNTRAGCHFLLQCMTVKSESEVAQSCLTLRDPMDCSLPGPSVRGIFQARVLEWGATAFSVLTSWDSPKTTVDALGFTTQFKEQQGYGEKSSLSMWLAQACIAAPPRAAGSALPTASSQAGSPHPGACVSHL